MGGGTGKVWENDSPWSFQIRARLLRPDGGESSPEVAGLRRGKKKKKPKTPKIIVFTKVI